MYWIISYHIIIIYYVTLYVNLVCLSLCMFVLQIHLQPASTVSVPEAFDKSRRMV